MWIFDQPYGCFDRFMLICEGISSKQRRIFINSTICTDLIPEEYYRIYVETKRAGWETVVSEVIETQLVMVQNNDSETMRSISIYSFQSKFYLIV